MNRDDFMSFFRDDEKLLELSVCDRVEIFKYILIGSSDFTKELLDEVLLDYGVAHLEVVEVGND